jgi:hypothetical protein
MGNKQKAQVTGKREAARSGSHKAPQTSTSWKTALEPKVLHLAASLD